MTLSIQMKLRTFRKRDPSLRCDFRVIERHFIVRTSVLLGERERAHLVVRQARIFYIYFLAYRNCLRASFYAIFLFFLHWHCMHWPPHSLERTWASQLRQSMLTRTSTAHGDPSLAAPMLTTRFSYTHRHGGTCTSYIALYLKNQNTLHL